MMRSLHPHRRDCYAPVGTPRLGLSWLRCWLVFRVRVRGRVPARTGTVREDFEFMPICAIVVCALILSSLCRAARPS